VDDHDTPAFLDQVDRIAGELAGDYSKDEEVAHVIERPMPSEDAAEKVLDLLFDLLYLGYFGDRDELERDLEGHVKALCRQVYELLAVEIAKSYRHQCWETTKPCCLCRGRGDAQALHFLEHVAEIRDLLKQDVQAAYDGDPAAKSLDEIIFSYPGLRAITVHRIAHVLHALKVPVLPRIMSEYAHRETGIDIHPGAQIGARFFIDHGTGVVLGETSIIGNNVRLYHGVTLGAFSLPTEQVNELRYKKRHPTIEDDVIIYPNATVLGGETVIGRGSVVGGNCWVTKSVPANTTVAIERPKLQFKNGDHAAGPPDAPCESAPRQSCTCNHDPSCTGPKDFPEAPPHGKG